ncbi:MAG: hypothetical protein NTW49_06670 [Bacteroidia bacterium]|nr:hypothetical protein [Bacteroidia bacterium]
MKKSVRIIVLLAILTVSLSYLNSVKADPPLPPGYGTNGNGGNPTPNGGSAPIDGGLSFLIALGLGFGARKYYKENKIILND